MKRNKQSIITILACSALFSACSKYLDVNPDNRTQINSVEKVAQLVASAYPDRDYLAFTETASDNSEDKGPGIGDVDELVTKYYTWQDVIGDETNSAEAYWNACYAAIASANQALEAIDQGNFGDAVLPYKGEALVARAYAHHMLAIFFAKAYTIGEDNSSPGIPYVTKPETELLAQYTRGTVQSTYDNIEKDLEEGIKLLSSSAYKVPKYHFTLAAAHAFASRFYLFKGEWQKVVDNANAVVPGGDYTGSLRPISSTFRDMSVAEFNVGFSKTDVKATLLMANAYSSYQRLYGTPRYGFGETLTDMFTEPNVTGKRLENKVLNYGPPNYTTYKWKEYFYYATESTGFPYLPFILFTTDEALMNRAEAYAELDKNDLSLRDINTFYSVRVLNFNPAVDGVTPSKIMAFFSISDPKEGLIKTILEAKKAEFLQEGIRWLDLVRRHLPVIKNQYSPTGEESTIELDPDDPRRVFQIPQTTKLAGLELNPR